MSGASPIVLERLAVGYGRQPIIQDLSFEIPRGSFIGLIGANGSGKTTLLKTIAGILPPISGQARANPGSVIGYVPQRDTLDSSFLISTAEVVLMGACGRRAPGRLINRAERDWSRECMRQTGVIDCEHRPFAQLSGGQKQRALIARALVARPDLLLLDEPTTGVDPTALQSIIDLLARLHADGMTILMVNHDLPVVRRLATHLWWARHGSIQTGSPADLPAGRNFEAGLESD